MTPGQVDPRAAVNRPASQPSTILEGTLLGYGTGGQRLGGTDLAPGQGRQPNAKDAPQTGGFAHADDVKRNFAKQQFNSHVPGGHNGSVRGGLIRQIPAASHFEANEKA